MAITLYRGSEHSSTSNDEGMSEAVFFRGVDGFQRGGLIFWNAKKVASLGMIDDCGFQDFWIILV